MEMGRLKNTSCLVFLVLLASLQFAAGGSTAQNGNITIANLTSNATSTWYGLCGNASGSPAPSIAIRAIPGAVNCSFITATGSSGCIYGPEFINLIFSRSAVKPAALTPGNLTVLDNSINRESQKGTATFTTASTFQTHGWGSIAGVPTAYTNPSAAQDFPLGYLQDQAGNLVFITPVTDQQPGYDGNPVDFQAMLPTADGQNTTFHLFADLSCNSGPLPLQITTASLDSGQEGIAYSFTLSGTGGTLPYTWTVTGLPSNLTYDPGTGIISGIPDNGTSTSSPYSVDITLQDSGSQTAGTTLSLAIASASPLQITTASLDSGQEGTAYSYTLLATGGTQPYTWTVTGLPSGLTYDPGTGIISGTPATGTSTISPYSISITAQDSASQTASTTLSLAISAAPPPPPPPTPSGGGTYTVSPGITIPYYHEVPKVGLPPVPIKIEELRILSFTPYREASPGEQVIVNPLIQNPSADFVTVNIGLSGVGGAISTPAQNVLLAPYSKQTVPFSMKLPDDLPAGYYSFSVEVQVNNSKVSYPAIIRVVPTYRIGQPTVHRQFILDYVTNETTVILTVTNTANETLPHLQVFESLPASLAGLSSQIKFSSEAGGNLGGDIAGTINGPNIRWDLENIHAGESRSIYYNLPFLATDTSEYPTWNLAELVAINPAGNTDILIRDLQTPSLLPGDKGEVTMTLFNSGVIDRDVNVDVLPPAGWKITPRSVSLSIASRDSQQMSFVVEAPSSADAGTFGFTVRVTYGDTFFDKLAYIYVNRPIVQLYAPPLSDQFLAFLGANTIPVVFVAVAGALLAGGLYFAYRFLNAPRFDEGRLEDMQNMEQMFNQKIIGKKKET